MKKTTALLLCAALMLALAGCGGAKEAQPSPTAIPAATKAPQAEATPVPAAEPTPAPAVETPEPAPETDEALAETVKAIRALKDRPVSELYALIGEPTGGSDYGSSCLVTGGQDGMLYYDEFTVYTLVQPDGTETVYDITKPDGMDFDF